MPKLGSVFIQVRAKTDKYKRDLANAKTLTEKASVVMQHQISKISFATVAASAAIAGAAIAKLGLDGFRAMEKLKLSTASMASTITSFAKDADKDLSGTYLQALGYSEQLVLKMEELNAQTVATGENLTAMVETMAQGGVLLDINNKKQLDGFLAIANALALITQGQNADIQFRQEIRGLINGEVRATNMLARLLQQRVGGSLKEHVKLWKEQGTLIESAGALLEGFQEGAKDLANTWLAVGTTLETMYNRTLRGLMAPVYEDIVKLGKEITLNALDQNSALNKNAVFLRTVVFKGWEDIKNAVEVTLDLITAFEGPLMLIGKVLGLIIDGWGQIFAILPAITDRVKLITQAVFDSVEMVGHFGAALWKVASLDFQGALESLKGSKEAWIESGKKTGEAFSSGFLAEIDSRLATFNKDLAVKPSAAVLPPALRPPPGATVDSDKELKKLQEANQKKYAMDIALAEQIGKDTWQIRQEGYENALKQQEDAQTQQTQAVYDIWASFNEQYNELGKTRFDIEREQVERMTEIYREAGIEENRISELASQRNIDIANAEQNAKLSIYQDAAGGIADTFRMIAQAGGEQSLAAFRAYQAFAMVEATIAGHKAYTLALADVTVPSTLMRQVNAGIALGSALTQVGMIGAAAPPSYDVGGVSNARGVYQTGNIREAHVPIPSGKIPVEINGGQQNQEPPQVNIFQTIDPSVMDAWAASSRGGNAIFNTLGSQPQRLKNIQRGG